MSHGAIVVTGTDTDVGKTVVAAGLTMSLNGAFYWKPVQAGTDPTTDSETVRALSGLPTERFLPEGYRLKEPASPHLAARMEDIAISPKALQLPEVSGPLVIEGAGGVMVPLTDDYLVLDLLAQWRRPAIIVARTTLGTINHSLLTIAALRARAVPIGGIIFSGEEHLENQRIIPQISGVRSLGRLPLLASLDPARLNLAMEAHIDIPAVKALME
jgi:dethiobiotin synthetase